MEAMLCRRIAALQGRRKSDPQKVRIWAVRAFQAVWRLEDELRNWRFELRGEQAVAESLAGRGVAAAGYVAFHDVPGEGEWNVDHVVVGPGGVFVLEKKARPRRKATRPQAEQDVFLDGKVPEFPWCYDRKAAEQAERHCRSSATALIESASRASWPLRAETVASSWRPLSVLAKLILPLGRGERPE
jgi:hypothetical protein